MASGGNLPPSQGSSEEPAAVTGQGEASGAGWADEVLRQGHRLAQLEDRRCEMLVEWKNLENEIRTLENENAHLKKALEKEKGKVAEVRLMLDAYPSARHVGPSAHRSETTQHIPEPVLADAQGDAALRSPLPVPRCMDLDTADDNDLNNAD